MLSSALLKVFLVFIFFVAAINAQSAVNENFRSAQKAIREEKIELLKALLQKNPALAKQKDSEYPGETLLHTAAGNMSSLSESEIVLPTIQLEMVKLLLEKGANINALDASGETALIDAAKQGNFKIAEFLIEQKADVKIKNEDGNNALHFAAGTARKQTAQLLLKNGLSLQEPNNVGQTPFHLACQTKYSFAHVAELIKAGVDVNAQDQEGYTPLFYAVSKGNLNSSKLLIENKANLNLFNISSAAFTFNENNLELAELLLQKGLNTELKNSDGETILHQVVITNLSENLKLLLKYKANPNAIDNSGQTVLHKAVKSAHADAVVADVVKQLVAAKVDINIKDKQGKTAYDLAKDESRNEIAALIKPAVKS